ncbi:hypothetical protein M408DRAFT_318905, partial [Serendipita vermifera MAFF 305830]
NADLYRPLAEVDPVVQNIIDKETWRQFSGLELIASEVSFFTSTLAGFFLTSTSSVCLVVARFSVVNASVGSLACLCRGRWLGSFFLDRGDLIGLFLLFSWLACLLCLIPPLACLVLVCLLVGGCLIVVFCPGRRLLPGLSISFRSLPSLLGAVISLIVFRSLGKPGHSFPACLFVWGVFAFVRGFACTCLRSLAVGQHGWFVCWLALRLCLLVAGSFVRSFVAWSFVLPRIRLSVVGARVCFFFFRTSVAPGMSLGACVMASLLLAWVGGPPIPLLASLAPSFLSVWSPWWHVSGRSFFLPVRSLGSLLVGDGCSLPRVGIATSFFVWSVRSVCLVGWLVGFVCLFVCLSIVLPSVSGDVSGSVVGWVCVGLCSLRSRWMKEEDIRIVAEFLHRAVQLSLELQKEAGSKLLKDFERVATTGDGEGRKKVLALCKEVRAFAKKWPLPGVDVSTLKKPEGFEGDDA